jgi:hypothetical protein
MSGLSRQRARAGVLFVAPAILLAGILLHPFVSTYLDVGVVAAAVMAAPERWAASHVIIPVGMGLLLLAVVVIRGEFRRAGEQRWSVIALPPLFVGGAILGAVAAAEITLTAVVSTGSDLHAVMESNAAWTMPYILIGGLAFAIGWLSTAVAFHRAPILPRVQNWVAIVASLVIAVGLFIPLTVGTYLLGFGALIVSWMVGFRVLAVAPPEPAAAVPAPEQI